MHRDQVTNPHHAIPAYYISISCYGFNSRYSKCYLRGEWKEIVSDVFIISNSIFNVYIVVLFVNLNRMFEIYLYIIYITIVIFRYIDVILKYLIYIKLLLNGNHRDNITCVVKQLTNRIRVN